MGRKRTGKPKREFKEGRWPWHEKFLAWLTRKRMKLTEFATEFGYPQSTLQKWVVGSPVGTRSEIPFAMLRCIAEDTGIAVEFWADDAISFEHHEAYTAKALRRSFDRQIKRLGLTEEEVREAADAFQNAPEARRTLAIRRAARPSP